jgi:protein phosphatase
MATTAAVLLLGSDGLTVAHVGDSRVYCSHKGRIAQVTHDHSWVSEQVRAGSLTEADARQHPWRNVVTRALAGGDDPEVDVAPVDAAPGDLLMICSDGLSGVVTNETCQAIIAAAPSLEAACESLIAAANKAGGPDNITVALLKIDVD